MKVTIKIHRFNKSRDMYKAHEIYTHVEVEDLEDAKNTATKLIGSQDLGFTIEVFP